MMMMMMMMMAFHTTWQKNKISNHNWVFIWIIAKISHPGSAFSAPFFSRSPRSGSTRLSSSGRHCSQGQHWTNHGEVAAWSWTVWWRGLPRLAPRTLCYTSAVDARRIFSRGALFSWKKVDDLFSRRLQNTGVDCNCKCTKHFTTFPGASAPSSLPLPVGALDCYGSLSLRQCSAKYSACVLE